MAQVWLNSSEKLLRLLARGYCYKCDWFSGVKEEGYCTRSTPKRIWKPTKEICRYYKKRLSLFSRGH